jgi:hypothetical protein
MATRADKGHRQGGRRRPRSGLPRLWPDLRCAEAVETRREADTLAREHPGAPRDAVVDAALRRVRWFQAEADLSRARARRDNGRGRRPSEVTLRGLQKRAGLEWTSYREALARLEALAERDARAKPSSLANYIANRYGSAGAGR